MGRQVVTLAFPSTTEAQDAMNVALDLQRRRVIVVHDAVMVHRSEDGELALDEPVDVTAIAVAVPGVLLGAFFGTLLAGPLGFIVGALIGGALGILIAKLLNQGISDRMLLELERRARPGQTILALQIGTADAAEVARRIPMKTTLAGVLLLVAATTSARADDPMPPIDPTVPDPIPVPAPQPEPPPAPATVEVDVTTPIVMPETQPYRWYDPDRIGFAISAGGGVQGFTGNSMRDTTDDGGNWDVRAMLGTRLPVTLEASYLGSAQKINALGLDNNAVLMGNGVQGDLRINATTDMAVQPFLYGGLAWRRYTLENASFNTSDVIEKDDVLEIPLGVGVAYKLRGFMLDARAEWRGSFNENLVPASASGNAFSDPANLNRWGVNANVGYEF